MPTKPVFDWGGIGTGGRNILYQAARGYFFSPSRIAGDCGVVALRRDDNPLTGVPTWFSAISVGEHAAFRRSS